MAAVQSINSDVSEWSLLDADTGALYRKLPSSHISELRNIRHKIKLGNKLFTFYIRKSFERDKDHKGPGHFKVIDFAAGKCDPKNVAFKYLKLREAYHESYPLLEKFLAFVCESELDGADLYLDVDWEYIRKLFRRFN